MSLRFAHFFCELVKYLCSSSRGSPDNSKTPSTCKVWMILKQVMTIPKNWCFVIIKDLLVFRTKLSIKTIFGNFCSLSIAKTWLKIIQTLQVGGVLETSGPPLHDGHRNFEDWCIQGDLKHAFWFSKKIAPTVVS